MKKIYNVIFLFVIFLIFLINAIGEENFGTYDKEQISFINGWAGNKQISFINEWDGKEKISSRFGTYRVTEHFTPYRGIYWFMFPQEADMLVGRVIEITEDRLITYDSGQDAFLNFFMKRFTVDNPKYEWEETAYGLGESAYDNKVEGIIKVYIDELGLGASHSYYALSDKDAMILRSNVTGEEFLLERCEEEAKEDLPEWTKEDSQSFMEKIYGDYQVVEFIPTKFYPALDSSGNKTLPQEEVEMMIGKTITVSKDMFVTYDNYRLLNSEETGRYKDDFWLKEVVTENPAYKLKNMRSEEIFGIRDGILPDSMVRQEYVEIDVYPWYTIAEGYRFMPQMYVVAYDKIVMFSMGEYFLLEKTEGLERQGNDERRGNSFSVWEGSYVFSKEAIDTARPENESENFRWFRTSEFPDEFREYRIKVEGSEKGEYCGNIVIDIDGIKTEILSDIRFNESVLFFEFRQFVSGDKKWELEPGELLLFFRVDEDGVVYTMWEALDVENDFENWGVYFIKE